MAIQHDAKCHALFVGYLGRPPSATELSYWSGQLAANSNGPFLSGLVTHLQAQASFVTDLAKTTEQLVTDLFVRLTGQEPSMALYTHFVNGVASGLYDVESLPVAILRDCGIMPRSDGAGGLSYGAPDNAPAEKSAVDLVTASGTDFVSGIENKVSYSTSFTEALDTPSENTAYASSSTAAAAALSGVTDDASLTTALAAVDTTVSTTVSDSESLQTVAATITLTTNADIVGTAASIGSAMRTTSANDTINATVGSAASAGTFSIIDSVSGGEGTDTMLVTLTSTAAFAPIVSSVEVVELRALSNETAYYSFANSTGMTALQVSGTSDINIAGLLNNQSVAFTADYTKTATLALGTDGSADSLSIVIGQGNSAQFRDGANNSATGIEVVNLVANTAYTVGGDAGIFDFQRASALNISGTANVSLNFQAGTGNFGATATALASGNMVNRLANVNASALQGNLTLYLSSAGLDQTIIGGIGNDTFYASGGFNQSDNLDGGAGTDTLSMLIAVSGTNRPVIQGIETLTVDFDAEGVIDLRNASAASITTLNTLGLATASTFSALSSATRTINVYSGASAGGLTFNYATGAPSDVTINLSNQATATSTASYSMGDLTVGNNTGSLMVNVVGSATGQAIDAFVANSVASLTIDVTSGQFVASAMNANAAKTVVINVNNGKTANVTGNASFTAATSVSINVSGATANADFANLTLGAAGNLNITMGSQATALTLNSVGGGASAGTASFNNTISITNNGNGDVVLSALDLTTAGATAGSAGQGTFTLSVNQTGTGASFAASAIDLNHIESASLTFTLAGQGVFELAATADFSAATAQVILNSTAIATGAVSANFTAWADTNVTFDVRLGMHSAIIALGAGADTVQFGLNNQQTVFGGLGNDELTMNNTAVSIAAWGTHTTAASALDGTDTIFGAGSGDIILFQGYGTAASTGSIIGTAITTGTGWAVSTAISGSTAQVMGTSLIGVELSNSANDYFMAMYTAAGDMIIQVLIQTASPTASLVASADSINQIVLNGKGDVTKTALLRIDTNGSGLLLTIL